MKKRGLSPVIAEVLLILLILASVAILANFVTKFVKTELPKSTECLAYKDYFSFQESFELSTGTVKYNCFQGNKYAVSIKSGSDEKLAENVKGFEVVFTDAQGLTSVSAVNVGGNSSCTDGGTNLLSDPSCSVPLALPDSGGVKTYVYHAQADKRFKTAEVYPVLSNGRLCEKSDSIELISCESSVTL